MHEICTISFNLSRLLLVFIHFIFFYIFLMLFPLPCCNAFILFKALWIVLYMKSATNKFDFDLRQLAPSVCKVSYWSKHINNQPSIHVQGFICWICKHRMHNRLKGVHESRLGLLADKREVVLLYRQWTASAAFFPAFDSTIRLPFLTETFQIVLHGLWTYI